MSHNVLLLVLLLITNASSKSCPRSRPRTPLHPSPARKKELRLDRRYHTDFIHGYRSLRAREDGGVRSEAKDRGRNNNPQHLLPRVSYSCVSVYFSNVTFECLPIAASRARLVACLCYVVLCIEGYIRRKLQLVE